MTEAQIKAAIRLAVGKLPHVRLFNCPTGSAWLGKVVSHDGDRLMMERPKRVEFGLVEGGSDLIGLVQVTITQEMVGRRVALFAAAEVKRPGVAVPEHQRNFIDFVTGFGGVAGVVRSADDALRLVGAA